MWEVNGEVKLKHQVKGEEERVAVVVDRSLLA